MTHACRSWVGLLLVITSTVARAEEAPRLALPPPGESFEAAHGPSFPFQPSPMVTSDVPPAEPAGAANPSLAGESAGSPAKRRAVVSSNAPSAIDRYLASAFRLVPGSPQPLMALKIGAVSKELGLSNTAAPELALLAPDAARHYDQVMAPHSLETGLLVGSLVLGTTLALAPLIGSFLPVEYLRMSVVVAGTLAAGVAVQAQYRPERLESLGRLVDAANAEVLASLEAAHGPLSATDRGLVDLYARSVVHYLAPPGGLVRLWRNGKVLDPGPGHAFLPSLLADVPAASLMARELVRLHRLAGVMSGVGIGVELLGAVAALLSIPLGTALSLPLLVAGCVTAIVGASGALAGALKAGEAQMLLPKVMEAHAEGLATRIGGRLP